MHSSVGLFRQWRERLATPVVRNGIYLLAAEGVSGLLGLGFWAVVARTFPDADAGVGATLIATATLLAVLSTVGFNISLVRFLPERGTDVVRLINSSVTIGGAVAAVLALGFALSARTWSPILGFLGREPIALSLFLVFTAVWTIYVLFDAAFIGLGRAKYVFFRAVVYNALKIPLPLLLVAFVAPAFAIYAAWGVGLLVANGIAVGLLFGRVVPSFRLRLDVDRATLLQMVRYSAENHVTNVLGVLPGLAFPLLLAHTLPAENAAYFYVAWALANLLFIVPGSLFTSVFAEGSQWPSSLRGNALNGLFLSFAVLVPGVAVALAAGEAVLRVFKPTFAAAAPLLQVLALAAVPLAVNVLYITILRVEKRLRPVIGMSAVTTIGALLLGLLLVPFAGLMGTGLGFVVAQSVVAVYAIRAMRKEGLFSKPV